MVSIFYYLRSRKNIFSKLLVFFAKEIYFLPFFICVLNYRDLSARRSLNAASAPLTALDSRGDAVYLAL